MSKPRVLERYGIEARAEDVWRAVLSDPSASVGDLASTLNCAAHDVDRALTSLAAAHLLRAESGTACGFMANNPEVALEVLAVRAEQQIAAEEAQIATIREQIPALSDLFVAGRAKAGLLPGFEVVTSIDEIRQQIYLESERSSTEVRSLLHNFETEAALHSREADQGTLGRGLRMRTILRPSDLHRPGLYEAVQWLHDRGEDVRVSEDVPTQMLIYDQRMAIIRVDPEDAAKGAMFIRVQNLVDLLSDLYERLWRDADPLFPQDLAMPDVSSRQAQILILLATGTKDEAISRSLGIGVRTIRREISDLKDVAGAASRTDLIAAAIRRGWIQSTDELPGPTQANANGAEERV